MSSERLIYNSLGVRATLDDAGIFLSEQYNVLAHSEPVFGCFGGSDVLVTHIPYKSVLWAETTDTDLEVTHVLPRGKLVTLQSIRLDIDAEAAAILGHAYPNQILPSVLVLINPHGGQGKARSIYSEKIEPILRAAHAKVTYYETKYSGHAADLVRELDVAQFDVIACCSGDGIPHEVINGLYQRSDRVQLFLKVAVTQLPCGSGNALSLSTHGTNDAAAATVAMLKLTRAKLDLMALTQGIGSNAQTKLSFLSQCYGVIADCDIGTEHLRWMGPMRFELGIVHKVLTRAKYPCELYVHYHIAKDDIQNHVSQHIASKTDTAVTEETFKLAAPPLDEVPPKSWTKVDDAISSNLSIFYVGNMPYMLDDAQFFPAALPDDGVMDLIVSDTRTSVVDTTKLLLQVDKGRHVHSEHLHHAKIKGYRLVPRTTKKNYISVDGESFPYEPFQVEVLPRVLTILVQGEGFVKTDFTS